MSFATTCTTRLSQTGLASLIAALCSTAQAFPTPALFNETAANFGLNFSTGAVSGGGCTSSDETRTQTFNGLFWQVALSITEDDCGDDELRIAGAAFHKSAFSGEPNAPVFSFVFDLMNGNDASHYGNGSHRMGSSQTLLHLMPHNFTYAFDVYQAQLDFHVVSAGSFIVDRNIDSYSLSLSANHVDEPSSAAVAGLALALVQASRLRTRRLRGRQQAKATEGTRG